MTTITESLYPLEFVVSEASGSRSREAGTLISGQDLDAGTVLGALTRDTVAVAADAGNTGAAVVTATTVTLGSQTEVGVYTLTCTTAGSSGGGVFQVAAPSGALLPPLTAGAAYAGDHISLTLPEGDGGATADWALGDIVTITVSGSDKYTQFDQDGADGSETAVAILAYPCDASAGDADCVILARDAEVNGNEITWPSDIEAGETTAAIAQLAAVGLIVR